MAKLWGFLKILRNEQLRPWELLCKFLLPVIYRSLLTPKEGSNFVYGYDSESQPSLNCACQSNIKVMMMHRTPIHKITCISFNMEH